MTEENSTSNHTNQVSFSPIVTTSVESGYGASLVINYDQSVDSNLLSTSNVQTENEGKITSRQIIFLLLIIYGNFWVSACYSLLAPFFPKEANKKGMSATVYGFIFGVFQLVVFLTSPLYAYFMPVITPRFLIISGLFVSSSCSVLFGILCYSPDGSPFIALAFAVRIVEALGTSAYYVAALTTAATEFPTRVATVLSIAESSSGIGMIVGPTIGGALYQVGGYDLPFLTLGGILMVGTIISIFVVPRVDRSETLPLDSLLVLIKYPRIYIYMAAIIYSFSFIGFNDATLSAHLNQFHLKPIIIGAIFTVPAGLYALSGPLWGYLCDKILKPEIASLFGSVCCVIGLMFLGPVPFLLLETKLWLIIVSLVCLGIGIGGILISSFILCLSNAIKLGLPDDTSTNALVSGIFTSTASLGAFVGPSIGGILLDNLGYENGTTIFFGISIFMVVVLLLDTMFSSIKRTSENGTEEEKLPILQE